MKILQLQLENFKRIEVVEITPTGNLVQITGKNAQGKTSVLDAIWVTLAGAEHLQSVPIRKGTDKATLSIKLGGDKVEMVATRTIRKKKEGDGFSTTLTVESADGFRAPSPQKMLDDLLGSLTFDPLAFTRMKPKDQFDELRRFVPGIDFDEIAAKNKSDYAKRTEVNRDAKQFRAAAEGVTVPDSIDATTQMVDEGALTKELAGAAEHNALIQTRQARRDQTKELIAQAPTTLDKMQADVNAAIQISQDRAASRVKEINDEIARLTAQIASVTAKAETEQNELMANCMIAIADFNKKTADMQKALDEAEALPEPIDVDALTVKITEARWINEAIRARDLRARHVALAEGKESEAQKLTEAMEARDKAKTEAIAKAELPVAGLGFGDGVVTFNGLPLDQASDAEQLRTSIAIGMASNAKLRVMRVRDGSLLDDDAMVLLAEMAEKHDYQVWIERVSSDGKVGFVLEEGHLKATESELKEGSLL